MSGLEIEAETPFTEEEVAYGRSLRSFFDRELDARLADFEAGADPRQLFDKAAEAGLLGACIPEEYGGPGCSIIFNIILSYELGRSLGFGTVGACISTDLGSMLWVHGGTEAQKQEIAPRILGGAIQAMAMTESGAGSDPLAMRMTAVEDGDDYVLNGSKVYISNGHLADYLYVVAKTDASAGYRGLTLFIVPGDAVGLTRSKMKTMAWPGSGVGDLNFDNVRVPKSSVLGSVGGAVKLLSITLAADRLQTAARALAQAELAFDMTVEYAKIREINGQFLIDFQHTKMKLADMKIDIEMARRAYHAAIRKLRVDDYKTVDAAIDKVWITEMSARVLDGCVQLYGGAGFMDEMPISRLYTSNRQFRIVAGTSELLRMQIARSL